MNESKPHTDVHASWGKLTREARTNAGMNERYLARFPESALKFGFAELSLREFQLQDAHLVPGLGQA